MKRIKYIYQIALAFLLIATTSCDDWFDLRPKSDTIFEDMWQNEDDVLSVVGACYRAMNEAEFIDRLLVWGEVRSDNVLASDAAGENLSYILELNLLPTNEYTAWKSFYTVINYCNSVIENAPLVRDRDPNFTDGQMRAYIAEVKGIRALCYFTLVRAFRDVPFVTKAYTDDEDKPFQQPQEDPQVIIRTLIEDLREVEDHAVREWANEIYTKGRITRTGIRAIIADMYLWLNEYDNCITYCDKILNNPDYTLTLVQSTNYNDIVFYMGNSSESIFELQFSSTNIENYVLSEMYDGKSRVRGGRNSSQLVAYNFDATDLFPITDYRSKDGFFYSAERGSSPIRKYVSYRSYIRGTGQTVQESDYVYNSTGDMNWIFYRLPDIYLMKAEALVELNRDLEEAFELACFTYYRANPDVAEGSLNFSSYSNQTVLRNFVFDERQREFMFEGKRYFDLLRRINREGSASNIVGAYLVRKYSTLDQSMVRTKLSEINALYMPINKDELNVNTALEQNPFYATNSGIQQN